MVLRGTIKFINDHCSCKEPHAFYPLANKLFVVFNGNLFFKDERYVALCGRRISKMDWCFSIPRSPIWAGVCGDVTEGPAAPGAGQRAGEGCVCTNASLSGLRTHQLPACSWIAPHCLGQVCHRAFLLFPSCPLSAALRPGVLGRQGCSCTAAPRRMVRRRWPLSGGRRHWAEQNPAS